MKIAFYAPLKSPHHPHPSGDRRIARLLIRAMESSGHEVELMSELRAWEGRGDQARQHAIQHEGEKIADQIIQTLRTRPPAMQPQLWFSYHLYHKAPDWIGPRVADGLGIPYVVAEASYAAKQENGDWSSGLEQVKTALERAAAIICTNPRDLPGIRQLPIDINKIHHIDPFTDLEEIPATHPEIARQTLATQLGLSTDLPWLVSVAMMRHDAKLLSYQHLARTLALVDTPFQLLLIGDGRAREAVEKLFSGRLAAQTRFLGEKSQLDTLSVLLACDFFIWPAVNEAIGMALLEAQACGLPVVAGASGAIPGIVQNGESGLLFNPEDNAGMAKGIQQLIRDTDLREAFSKRAKDNIRQRHSLISTAAELNRIFSQLQ